VAVIEKLVAHNLSVLFKHDDPSGKHIELPFSYSDKSTEIGSTTVASPLRA
jgi:hypothetical protein